MKDFDAERKIREDREFRIGGKTFRFKPSVQQEPVDLYYDSLGSAEGTNSELLTVMDNLVLAGLEPEYHETWREVRGADVPIPLMGDDIHKVIRYMFEVMLDRPIESPSDSTSTQSPTGTSSTDSLPSAVEKS